MHVAKESKAGRAVDRRRVWRELGQLAVEGLAVGLVFSVLLAAAVYMVARAVRARISRRASPETEWRRSPSQG